MKNIVMTLILLTATAFLVLSEEIPDDEVELLPENVEAEKKKVHTFWTIMYEVCKAACVWPKFCNKFCPLLKPNETALALDKISRESHRPLETSTYLTRSPTSKSFVLDMLEKICLADWECVENCATMNFEPSEINLNATEITSYYDAAVENLYKNLYRAAVRYFSECAERNSKPTENVKYLLDKEEFCGDITDMDDENFERCLVGTF